MKRTISLSTVLLLTVSLLGTRSFAQDISASYSNSKFEEQFHVDQLQSIEMWKQPKTAYTPKNLVSEQQMRFNGKEGTKTYNSYTLHLTDYDTKITESYFKDGKFYIKDNTGKVFQTGKLQEVDTSKMETTIKDNTNRINRNSQAIQSNTQNINAIRNDVNQLSSKVNDIQSQVNKLDNKLEKGLATVTALTALHPNPRHQGKTQISIGTGMYADNVAGAIGIFHYLNNKVMLSAGASYGGDSSFAGNVGITIGF